MNSLQIIKPDDWHLHLRDGEILKAVLPESERHFARALIMPNLIPPVTTVNQASKYRESIIKALTEKDSFQPLMTLYLTEDTKPSELKLGVQTGIITAVKLYPAGATTNSQSGVKDYKKIYPILETMTDLGLPLCVHGEVNNDSIDIFDRELVFIETVLDPIRQRFPKLKIIIEHITTKSAVDYVNEGGKNLGATITTHHLVINRNNILAGGIRPHYYCLPVAKREPDRLALLETATSGKENFFLGTDSAPHFDTQKESACGCAGCFTATNSIPILTQIFEDNSALENLENFVSKNGAIFYGLKQNKSYITLKKGNSNNLPQNIICDKKNITVFDPGFELNWEVQTTF